MDEPNWWHPASALDVRSELLPEEKSEAIREMQSDTGLVAMVGDGINDAPALSAADVGIALGCGADISRDVADICLLGNDLRHIAWCIDLAKQTMRVVRWNLAWAFTYNSVGIALAVSGFLTPIWASLLMIGSSLFVISNSLRLGGFPQPDTNAFKGQEAPQATIDALVKRTAPVAAVETS